MTEQKQISVLTEKLSVALIERTLEIATNRYPRRAVKAVTKRPR